MENTVAYYCGPALAGIKPSNIVACHKNKLSNIHEHVERLNTQLNHKDIYFKILCECEKRVIVMTYRKKALEKYINRDEIKEFLVSYGYPANAELEKYLGYLKLRMQLNEFPHEIGAFLGYPLHDILGFLHHKNEGCLLCGEWKVYHDADSASKLFKRFADCRNALLKRLSKGQSLAEVFCAA